MDELEYVQFTHQILSKLPSIVGCTTCGNIKVLDINKLLLVLFEAAKLNQLTIQSCTVIQSLADCVRLIKHLHHVVVRNAGGQAHLHSFLLYRAELGLSHLVLQGYLDDFLVFNVVVLTGIVLEHGGV